MPLTTGRGGGAMDELTWFWVDAAAAGLEEVVTRSEGLLLFCPEHGELLEPTML